MVSNSTLNGSAQIEYYDKWVIGALLIILTLVFSGLGYIEHDGDYRLSTEVLAVNLLYTLIAITFLRFIVFLLDQYFPWSRNVTIRFGAQVGITLLIYGIIQSVILFYLDTENYTGPTNKTAIFASYFVGTIAVLSINALYLLLYIRHRNKETTNSQDSKVFVPGRKGSKRTSILADDLRHIFIDGTISKALDLHDSQIILIDNLSDLENILNPSVYFRANRQNLVHREIIREVRHNDNKSCTIITRNEEHIIVSRHKSPSFKKWLKNL